MAELKKTKEKERDFEEEFRKALKEEGLDDDDYWIKEIKDKLKIKNIRRVRILQIQEFLENSGRDEIEISALKAVMDKMTNVFTEAEKKTKEEEKAEEKRKTDEENAEKKKKAEEKEEKEKKEEKKNKREKQAEKAEAARKDAQKTVDDRNQKVEGTAQSGLREHNKNAPEGFGKSSNQIGVGEGRIKGINFGGGTEIKVRENWTASDTVRNVQGGTLCKGIYRINDIDELLKDRERVLQVSDSLVFKGPVSLAESSTAKFTSQETTQDFENNLDKSSSTKGGTGGVSYYGVSVEAGHSRSKSKEHEEEKSQMKEESFISVVTKHIVPVDSVDLEPKYLSLTEEAVDELKKIEETIKPLNYKSKGHFLPFFERFGSHVNHGVIDFGGILMSKATCQGFKEEDKEKVSDVVSEASETSMSIGFSMGGFGAKAGTTFSAEKVYGETKGKYHNKETYNTKVTLCKLGGPPELSDKDKWRTGLVEFSSLFRIVRRKSAPKPIWEILSHQEDGYENPVLLADAMKEEFSTLTKNISTYKSLDALRDRRDIWLQRYKNSDETTMVDCMKELESIRNDSDVNPTDWQNEILYSPEVQKKISTAVQGERGPNSLEVTKIFDSLRSILDPIDNISLRHFPNIESIKQALSEIVIDEDITPLEITTFSDLPKVLKESTVDQYCDAKMLSRRLEAFLLEWKTDSKVTEEFLVCICLLNRSGFSFRSFIFEHPVDKKNLEDFSDLLNKHLSEFQLLDNSRQKKAYVLDLALDNPQKLQTVQYMIDEMEEIDIELKEAWNTAKATKNTKEFEDKIQHHLHGDKTKINLERLGQKLSVKFQFTMPKQPLKHHDESLPQDVPHNCAERVLELIKKLEMTKYYPQKLKYEDVTMLRSDVLQKFSHTAVKFKELPWYFIKHIIGLDSNTRDNSVIVEKVEKKSGKTKNTENTENDNDIDFSKLEFFEDWKDEMKETGCDEESPIETTLQEMHPLDLIYIIFLCADDFLRQELADKMLKNQYAIPLILPAPYPTSDPKSWILHWCLKGISRTYTIKDTVLHKTLVDVETPLVSCISLGKETSWKSKLINEFLSPQQQTFWHQGLAGGNYKQLISEGMVELAWYLPGGQEDNKFNKAVTFTNLRGNALKHPAISNKLIKISSATYIFTEKLDKEVFDFIKIRGNDLKKLILVVLHKEGEGKSIEKTSKQFQDRLKMTNDQLISGRQDDSNFNMITRSLKESLNNVEENKHMSVSRLLTELKADDGMEVDDFRCRQGEEAAMKILKDIDELNKEKLGKAKKKILPCQSDLGFREQMAKYDKEICRQKEKKPNQSLQDYVRGIEENKQKLRLKQLHKPVSDTFMNFLEHLLNLDSTDRRYFLHCLKLGLDKRSEEIMQPLYKTYEQSRLELEEISKLIKESKKKGQQGEEINHLTSEVKGKQAELERLDRQLTYASFGLEHFFRELALMYENVDSLKTQTQTERLRKELADIMDALAVIVSEIFLDGTAIEIMDGDAIYVPVVWLNAVLKKIENSHKARVFKMAILGAQSCGKSTILNTVFGLHFPVSSGRCTRGAYIQLVKIEEEFRKTLNCEYILVIDSEGLMARRLTNRSEYDNELATFVLGQSDLTLVVIKGEGKEMEDVLPIAIHVFFRMKKVGELQGCQFVHQNMGSQDAKIKNLNEISDFVATLDEKTRAAAIDVEQNDKYKEFTDVLRYDKTKDNTFVPGLWDGSEPMGKVNVNYSYTMQQLKNEIVRRIKDITETKSLSTLRDSAERLDEIWDVIKKENFVFSFKNVLAIETHQQLTYVFNNKQWEIKTKIRNQIEEQKITIEKKVQEHKDQNTVHDRIDYLIDEAKGVANREIATSVHDEREDIKHYFVCNGQECTLKVPCSRDVRNRHLIADNEKEFMDDIKQLEETLEEEAKTSLNTLKTTLKANVQINKMNVDMDTRLKKKVKEVVRKEKTENMTKAEMEQIFNRLWANETADIMEDVQCEDKDINIRATTENLVLDRLGTNNYMYRARAKNTGFLVEKHHMAKKRWLQTSLNEDDMNRLHEVSKGIIRTTAEYYRKPGAENKFQTMDPTELIKTVLQLIGQTEDNRFETTIKYKVDLLIHIKKLAVDSVPWHSRKSTNQMIDEIVYNLLMPNEYSTYEERLGFVVHKKHVKTGFKEKFYSNKNEAKSCLQQKSKNIIRSTKSHYTSPTEGKKFVKTDADVLFEKIYRKTGEIPEATIDYQVDLMMYIENLAVEGFTELHNLYRARSSPRALLEKKRKGYYNSFMSLMKEGDSATTFCNSILRDVVTLNVDERLTTDTIFTEVRKYGGEIFRDLRGLQSSIMVDLYKEDDFNKYLRYIKYYETVVKEKLILTSTECLREKDRLHKLAHEKVSKIIDEITEAVTTTAEGPCNDADFISTLFSNLMHLRLPYATLASADLLEVTDKQQFGAIVIDKVVGPIKEQIEEKINKWDVKKKLEERKWEEFIFDEVVGCTERCPFCRVPCDIHAGGKKSGSHSATLHRPQGLGCITNVISQKLVVEDCHIDIASDQKFQHCESDGSVKWVPYKEYRRAHPDWTIRGDPHPDAEKYWKYVFAQYNEELAEYYKARKADFPPEWHQYTSDDIKKDIEEHYKVKVDL